MAFEHLFLELIPFLRPRANMFVRPYVSIKKQMSFIVCKLAQGLSSKAMNNLYGYEESTIRKYMFVVCKVLSPHDGLFKRYMHTPIGHRLTDTIRKFCDKTSLPNVLGAIDGTHIHFSSKPQRGLTPMPCDFFSRKNVHNVLLQAMCNLERFFWNVCK